jgi:hypothetical protein
MGAFIGLPGAILRGLAAFLTGPNAYPQVGMDVRPMRPAVKGCAGGGRYEPPSGPSLFELENEHDARYSAR